ncbi:hypothetical protein diail_6751 [Diaporthe ilicicola]|nr:hypothetical protein diail_6751 [Diaporthe ilicicola]
MLMDTLPRSIWAWIVLLQDPYSYYASQSPVPVPLPVEGGFPGQALSLSLQLGNIFLLLAGIAVVCCFSSSPGTARWYLVAVAFADYGHIYAAYRGIGPEVFWDVAQWNDMLWGNVGASAVLNLGRWLTVLGAFGPIRSSDGGASALGKKRA